MAELGIATNKKLLDLFNMMNDIPADSLWNKKSSFFTLIVELVKFKKRHGCLPDEETLRRTLVSLEEELQDNKHEDVNKNQFARYYYYTHQGTSGKKGRHVRGQLLQQFLEQIDMNEVCS